MKLKLNREFAIRHLFVTLLMVGLSGWFGYDGFVRYPATDAAELYRKIEGADAPDGYNLEAFKKQKIETQYGFTILSFLAALLIGGHLFAVSRFRFEFDESGYSCRGVRREWKDIKKVDRRDWDKKGIVRMDGIKLDAWHHCGVKEFERLLQENREDLA